MLLTGVLLAVILINLPRREIPTSEGGYTLRFNIPRNMPIMANNYALFYEPTTKTTALEYAHRFRINTAPIECDDAFTFENDVGILRVYRHIPKLIYEVFPNTSTFFGNKMWKCCISQATSIMEGYSLDIIGEGITQNESENTNEKENGHFTVKFIDTIEDLKNHALNNTVTLDIEGNLVAIEYFFVELELLGACSIKSILQAFNELPNHNGNVDITNVQLVYIYANSIIQPGYLFSGEDSAGEPFSALVKACLH